MAMAKKTKRPTKKTPRKNMARCQKAAAKMLREARLALDLNQEDVAQRLKHHHSWLVDIESGRRCVRLCEFLVLAKALGIDPAVAGRELAALV